MKREHKKGFHIKSRIEMLSCFLRGFWSDFQRVFRKLEPIYSSKETYLSIIRFIRFTESYLKVT